MEVNETQFGQNQISAPNNNVQSVPNNIDDDNQQNDVPREFGAEDLIPLPPLIDENALAREGGVGESGIKSFFSRHKKVIIIILIIIVIALVIYFMTREKFVSFAMKGGRTGSNSVTADKSGRLYSKTVVKDSSGDVIFEDLTSPTSESIVGHQAQIPISEVQRAKSLGKLRSQEQTMDMNVELGEIRPQFSGIKMK